MILQFSLVLGDVLIVPIASLRISYLSLGNQWPFGQFLCQFEVFLRSAHVYSSIYFLMLICIHRYFVVVRYKSKSLWKKRSYLRKLCLFIWLVLFVQGLPFFFLLKTSVIDGSAKCLNIHQMSSVYFFYNMVLVVLSLLLLFIISLTCRAPLGAAIAKAAKKSSRGKKMKSRSLQMTKVSLVIFAVCFGSLHICRTIGIIAKYHGVSCKLLHQVEDAYYVSWVFTMSNTCLDPLIYLFANDKFKRSFADSFQKCWGTN
ncbi:LOW QUALITY PROTEIN: P2Y purinoceptor 4-like [Spheniscus humboldti]